jgi:hypothetical protein
MVCSRKESCSDLRSPFSVCVHTFGAGDRGELVAAGAVNARHSPVQLLCRSLAQFGNTTFPKLLLMSLVCAMQIVETYVVCVCACGQVSPASPQTELLVTLGNPALDFASFLHLECN